MSSKLAIYFYYLYFTKSSIPNQIFLSYLFHEWVRQRYIIIVLSCLKFINVTMNFPYKIKLASYSWAVNLNVLQQQICKKTDTTTETLAFECDYSIYVATINYQKSTKSMYSKCNYIGNHFLLYHLIFSVSEISYCMCLSINYYWTSYSISYFVV